MRIHFTLLVTHLLLLESTNSDEDCELSITTVNSKSVCRRRVIFNEDFNSGISSNWLIEQFIPTYEKSGNLIYNYFEKDNVAVEKNTLELTPKILNDTFVRSGTLDFENCTGVGDVQCKRSAQFYSILPPVSSGRLNTKNSFSFKYGKVEITAKVPKGDWLVPELWLLPKNEKYGPGLESGRMVMMMARGNTELSINGTDLGYKVLEAHLLISSGETEKSKYIRVKNAEPWHSYFNKYLFTWTPDETSLAVNDIVVGKLDVRRFTENLANSPEFNDDDAKKRFQGSIIAPFDEEFYLSLGLSVGGRDFPDGSRNRNYVKPWRRKSVKEMTDFYSAKSKWAPTWNNNHSKFKILRVKVTSL